MSKQKLLITGSFGFLMSNFIRKIIYEKRPYEIVSIDMVSSSSAINNIYQNKNHSFYIGNVLDEHFVDVIFEYERPNIVLHGALETNNSDSMFRTNIIGTQILAAKSSKWGVNKFVLPSTYKCYGALANEGAPPWKEDAKLNPVDKYSASMVAAKYILGSYGLNYNVAHICNIYGRRQYPNKLIPNVVKAILNEQRVSIYGQGSQMREWIEVSDACAALTTIMENGNNGEAYNVSAGYEYSNIEVVNKICNAMGKKIEDVIQYISDKPNHSYRYAADASKLKALGWAPKIKFNDGINMTTGWYVNNKWILG